MSLSLIHIYAAIKAAVDRVIADIGGIEDIIKPGYKVIIKPNLVACPDVYKRQISAPLLPPVMRHCSSSVPSAATGPIS